MNEQLLMDLAPYMDSIQKINPVSNKTFQTTSLNDSKKELLIEAVRAWKEYMNSTDGKELEAFISASNLYKIQQKIKSIMDSPAFKILKKLLDDSGLDKGSFSIGLNIEAELIIGFSATIGIAIGVGNNKGVASAEFLSIAIDEGIDEGALAGVQFGVWTNAPSDLGGFSLATEIDFGIGLEIAVKAVYTAIEKEELLGYTVEVGAGEEDGVDEQESYTFIFGEQDNPDRSYFKPTYQPRKSNFLIVKSIKCDNIQSDGAGDENEVYFTFQADNEGTTYFYPTYDRFAMKEGDTWNCGRSIWFNSSIKINLYDQDGGDVDPNGDDDLLGTFNINLSELTLNSPRNYTIDCKDGLDHIKYVASIELIAKDVQQN
jgi:hypothetical protein